MLLTLLSAVTMVALAPAPQDANARPASGSNAAVQAVQWLRRPTGAEIAAAYPEMAQRTGQGGSATLKCALDLDGGLDACQVVAEAPLGAGFGAAALRLATDFRATPYVAQSAPARPKISIPIVFRTGGTAAPQGSAPDAATARARLAAGMQPAGAPMPPDETALDDLLRRNALPDLAKRLASSASVDGLVRDMNWERSRIYDGAGLPVVTFYMASLWRLGSAAPAPSSDGLKQAAVAYALYAVELIVLDGLRCADLSAPGHRLDVLFAARRPLWTYARGLSDADRAKVILVALTIEAGTASVRRDDVYLCSGGAAEMSESLKTLPEGALKVGPSQPGDLPGRQLIVPTPPNFKPAFVAAEKWRPEQTRSRGRINDLLTKLLTPPSPNASASGAAK